MTPYSAAFEASERDRLQTHLSRVEARLRIVPTGHLTTSQKQMRAQHLDRLHDYWSAGVFPQNWRYAENTPIFIDDEDRACAVGDLMRASGWSTVASEIALVENYARVPDIQNARVGDFVIESGLSVEELTEIQPGYSANDFDACANYSDCVTDVCGEQYEKADVVLDYGGQWAYLDDGTFPTDWNSADFDDTAWARGPAPLGYGDAIVNTTVGFGEFPTQKNVATLFRHTFTAEPRFGLLISGRIDDGAAIYLNGELMTYINMTEPYSRADHAFRWNDGEEVVIEISSRGLLEGSNTLAVAVHTALGNDPDLSFDLELAGLDERCSEPMQEPVCGEDLIGYRNACVADSCDVGRTEPWPGQCSGTCSATKTGGGVPTASLFGLLLVGACTFVPRRRGQTRQRA